MRKRFFGFGGANGQQGAYVTKQQRFATAPLPPIPYAVSDGIYGAAMPYVTSGVVNAYDPGTENIETNIHRNITKNYYINEEKNYFIDSDPKVESVERAHDPEVQTLPPPIVTTINMAAERITDNPSEIFVMKITEVIHFFVFFLHSRLGECYCKGRFRRSRGKACFGRSCRQ